MNGNAVPIVKDLVLLGGGHSHVAVLKKFGMQPAPGVRVTIVARDVHTPYSGMLPGFIAGHYSYDDAHVDLRPLAQFAGARLYHDEVVGLDPARRRVLCKRRPPVAYDVLSINTGSIPSQSAVPGAAEYALPVKPIDRFLLGWEKLTQQVLENGTAPFTIAIVGGGAGGVELALCTQYRLKKLLAERGQDSGQLQFHLFSDTAEILPTHNAQVRRRYGRTLEERGVAVHTRRPVVEVEPTRLHCQGGEQVECDAMLWVTHASAPSWARSSGLETDPNGFIAVNEYLQSVSHPDVFAAGDVAALKTPRPKSGVFAVRAGKPLAENLRRHLHGQRLKPFKPQSQFLSLISTGDKNAVASRGSWAWSGPLAWRLKDYIDRRWMRKYSELPEMADGTKPAIGHGLADADAMKEISKFAMRCGGCGAKVGTTVLSRVLGKLSPVQRDDILVGLDAPDDAAVTALPAGKVAVHTVDFFRAFVMDPYVFGRVTANHCLSDVFAMGATPQSALAVAVLPYGLESKIEEELYALLSGAMEMLDESRTALVGGHTGEGPELAFGLVINGFADPNRLLRKSGMRPGDRLLLTKPLGTGTLFAADMRQKAKGRWIKKALETMMQSNRKGAECLFRHGAAACTDVTGFGLLGHLVEMTRAAEVDVTLNLNALPLLDGALDTVRAGIFSSLQPQNIRLRRAIRDLEQASRHERYPLLFDPQTAGGLLASVPESEAEACLAELKALGYGQASEIGDVHPRSESIEPIRLDC